ncbi:MAG TPA: polyhydroxyalkanoic acid system family protein [Lacipirellula sp.]
MPKFNLEVPHQLSADEAKSRLERFIEMLKSQHGDKVSELEQSWAGNTLSFGFKTFGFKIAGAIDSLDKKLAVTGDIPFAAMMFKGKIEAEIREQLGRLMS